VVNSWGRNLNREGAKIAKEDAKKKVVPNKFQVPSLDDKRHSNIQT